MKFSAEMFKQIIAGLRSDGNGSRGHENRVEGRVGLRSTVEIITYGLDGKQSRSLTVWLRDMSVNGLGLVSTATLEANICFVVGFVRDKNKPLLVRYKVRYCKRLAVNLHSIGASFERFENDAEAKLVMGTLAAKIHPPKEELNVKAAEVAATPA